MPGGLLCGVQPQTTGDSSHNLAVHDLLKPDTAGEVAARHFSAPWTFMRLQPRAPQPRGAIHAAPGRAAVEAALRRRLDRAYLSYQWVLCVRMNRVYRGQRLWRCNVNFGDPHIVQYCVIFDRHRLITDRENHALDCSPPR